MPSSRLVLSYVHGFTTVWTVHVSPSPGRMTWSRCKPSGMLSHEMLVVPIVSLKCETFPGGGCVQPSKRLSRGQPSKTLQGFGTFGRASGQLLGVAVPVIGVMKRLNYRPRKTPLVPPKGGRHTNHPAVSSGLGGGKSQKDMRLFTGRGHISPIIFRV